MPTPFLVLGDKSTVNLIKHPKVQDTLDVLHAGSSDEKRKWSERNKESSSDVSKGGGEFVRLGEFYLAASREEGEFLYILARPIGARSIVEFGASFGISSVYLAAAAKDNGGTLTTTEVHPEKCAALEATFARAELSDVVQLLEGDARETLKSIYEPIDPLFLDGWKSAYLPIFSLLRPKLAPGALVLADNCHHEAAKDYLATVTSCEQGFATTISGGFAITYVEE